MICCELPIYKTLYPLIPAMFLTVKNMNRVERILIGEKMFNETVMMCEYILKANTFIRDPKMRIDTLYELRNHYETLRTLIRVASDTKALKDKAIVMYVKRLDSIGKQINSWIAATKKSCDKMGNDDTAIEVIKGVELTENGEVIRK